MVQWKRMRIIIIGAGLGGLSAALCFAKGGHNVQLFEQRSILSKQGSAIDIRPGASRIMHTWGLRESLDAISDENPTVLMRSLQSGDLTMRNVLMDASKHPDWCTMRDVLIQVLYTKALEAGAVIRFETLVMDVSEDHAHAQVHLKDDEAFDADLVLVADGIRSQIRSKILDGVDGGVDPILSDITMYGIRLHAQELSVTLPPRLTDNTSINCWIGSEGFVVTHWQETLQQLTGLYAVRSETDQQGLWDECGNVDFVRRIFAKACPEMTIPLQCAETCDRWRLAELPNLPRWTSSGGRIVLLGDSAHAMHPNAAQGFSMIVEDIGVLDFLLDREQDPAKSLPGVTKIWQDIRKPRAERIKEYARWNTRLFTGEINTPRHDGPTGNVKNLRDVEPGMYSSFNSARFVKWALDHDAVADARKYVESDKAKL